MRNAAKPLPFVPALVNPKDARAQIRALTEAVSKRERCPPQAKSSLEQEAFGYQGAGGEGIKREPR